MGNSNEPNIRAYIGATGSGKGVSMREHLRAERPRRLLVWDPLGEYAEFVRLTTPHLKQVIATAKAPEFAVSYYPGADPKAFDAKFAMFCRVAFSVGDCTMVVEELADVTSPSHAPMEWRRCTTQGRHRGLRIIAASQRPAQVDKQFLGGCTYIRCFTLRYPADRQAMAACMDVPLSDVQALRTSKTAKGTEIRFIEADFRNQKTTPGSLIVGGKK